FIFFFQAEDGIRDFHVTGVQTCALPISLLNTFPGLVTNSLSKSNSLAVKLTSSPSIDTLRFSKFTIIFLTFISFLFSFLAILDALLNMALTRALSSNILKGLVR